MTSTFRDMHAERDWLRTHVVPELEERLRARFQHLETIDLRWGIETTSESSADSREALVLQVCLNEIECSRPFMIGLVGDRYGWQPPAERIEAAASEAGFAPDTVGASVTELEIRYGALDWPDANRRCWFYLRDPLPYDSMPAEVAARYDERHDPRPGAAEAAEKLAALKERLETELPERTRRYRATWDSERCTVTGLEAWGERVKEDLWGDLLAASEQLLPEPQTWQDQDAWILEQFIEDRSRDFVGRVAISDELSVFADAETNTDTTWGLCVTGPVGAGKSSLFGHLFRRLRDEGLTVLAHAAGVAPPSARVDRMLRRWTSELAESLGRSSPLDDTSSTADIDAAFRRLLEEGSAQRRIVLLIDALDQFEPTPRGRHLSWLPERLPANVRLITTAVPGTQTAALQKRTGVVTMLLPPIDEVEAGAIVDALCARYHRALNPDVRAALLAKRCVSGEPAHGSPLWLELATEELNLLDADAFERADVELTNVAGGAERLQRLLLDRVTSLPADVHGLYGAMLDRVERLIGAAWVRAFVQLVAASRSGLRESDLRSLMPAETGESWDGLRFAWLRRLFRAHVTQRGLHAQWDFRHGQFRPAALARGVPDAAATKRLHAVLAGHLASLDPEDPLHLTETMVHLIRSGNAVAAAKYLGGKRTDAERDGAIDALAEPILGGQRIDGSPALDWTLSFLDRSRPGQSTILCNRFVIALYARLEPEADLVTLDALVDGVWSFTKSLGETGSDIAIRQRAKDLCAAYHRLGDIARRRGNEADAAPYYQHALALARRLFETDRERQALIDLIGSLLRHGDAQFALTNLDEARAAYREGHDLSRRLMAANPQDVRAQRSVMVAEIKLGDVSSKADDWPATRNAYRSALEIAEGLWRQAPESLRSQLDIGMVRTKLGNALSEFGEKQAALALLRRSVDDERALLRDHPEHLELRSTFLMALRDFGGLLLDLGDVRGAAATCEEMQIVLPALRAHGWSVGDIPLWMIVTLQNTGERLLAAGDLDAARRAVGRSLRLCSEFLDGSPNDAALRRNHAACRVLFAEIASAKGDPQESIAEYEAALETFDELLADQPGSVKRLTDSAFAANNLAVRIASSQQVRARHLWARCLANLESVVALGGELSPPLQKVREQLTHLGHGRQQAPFSAKEEHEIKPDPNRAMSAQVALLEEALRACGEPDVARRIRAVLEQFNVMDELFRRGATEAAASGIDGIVIDPGELRDVLVAILAIIEEALRGPHAGSSREAFVAVQGAIQAALDALEGDS